MGSKPTKQMPTLPYEVFAKALFEDYESIYAIDMQTDAYQRYHASSAYQKLHLSNGGEDFFASLTEHVRRLIHPEDQEYVLKMLRRENLCAGLQKNKYYDFVYRLCVDGVPIYHQIRAVKDEIDGRRYILMGIKNIEELMQSEKQHSEELASMLQKEQNHMRAILGGAAGYIEANLTKDLMLEISSKWYFEKVSPVVIPVTEENRKYSRFETWMMENYVAENREKYAQISSREYLLSCFERDEKRASVSFSTLFHGELLPCKKVFYLYQDDASGDVMAFCVVYDLTEQQRREKELEDLENELHMSRIRNFTSQMQPHFLYNALGSIQEIVLEDPAYASELIGDFTTHLRSCIRAMNTDKPLPFTQELDNIKAYVNIEKMRFGEKLNVTYEIGTTDFDILPLSIQPLVENAIRHGVYQRGTAGGRVTVRTKESPDGYIVEVEDDGVGFDVDALHREILEGKRDSTGLKNITFRLEKVMHAKVEIYSKIGTGTRVTVTVSKGG